MQQQYQSLTSVALNATGLAAAVAYAAGGYALSATTPNDKCGHVLTFKNKTATDHSGQNITFAGLDADGQVVTETQAGPVGSATLTTVNFYASAIVITASATTGADTFDIGWTATSVGPSINIGQSRSAIINTEIFCRCPTASPPTFSLQYTADGAPTLDPINSWLTHSVITGKSASIDGQITFPVLKCRLKFTAAGNVLMTAINPYPA